MLPNLSISCLVLLAFALVASAAPTLPPSAAPTLPPVRVPYIRNDDYVLQPTTFGHILTLTKPARTLLDEAFIEKAPGQVEVSGVYFVIYDTGKLSVYYEAGKNGYVAKYTYEAGTNFGLALPLSPNVYRSLAG